MKYYILFNPLAGSGSCKSKMDALTIDGSDCVYYDVTDGGYGELLKELDTDDKIVICGGDGTINRFLSGIGDMEIKNDILYFAAGSGNDFAHDIGAEPSGKPILMNDYIKNLPWVTVKGKSYRFINGIGLGIDGYCCHEVNRVRRQENKKGNYAVIALKGLFKYFTPVNATVTMDGETRSYKRTWMALTMKGKYFGGGMKVAPDQDRSSGEGEVTALVAHDLSRLRILILFVSIFKGNHTKYTKYVTINKGHEIKVEFDRPTHLQIDGETISEVTSYTVTAKNTTLFNSEFEMRNAELRCDA